MFRLAHISDIHLAPLPPVTWGQLFSKRITGYLNWQRNRKHARDGRTLVDLITHLKEQNSDHIAATGDLINLALDEEFRNATEWLANLGSSDQTSVVLGNHDCYVPGAYDTACRAWREYLGDASSAQSANLFPFTRIRDDVALIGANSGVATPPFMATGLFDEAQGDRLRTTLDALAHEGKFRVVMIHHPPIEGAAVWSKRLKGQDRFRSIIKSSGAELVIHGHTHVDSLNWIEGPEKRVPVVGVPSASHAPIVADNKSRHTRRPAARYNLFDIDGEPESWRCVMHQFGYQHGDSGIDRIGEPVNLMQA